TPGVHAVSNGPWGDSWPKTRHACRALEKLIQADLVGVNTLLTLLAAPGDTAENTPPIADVGPDSEQFLSALFIRGDSYGTRASTVILRDYAGNVVFHERGFDRHGNRLHDVDEHWSRQ